MALYTINDAQLAYGHVALLDHTDFALEEGERVEIYRPLIADPKEVRKQRAAKAAKSKADDA